MTAQPSTAKAPKTTAAKEPKAGAIRVANRQRIIAAAEEEFVRSGFDGATIQAIADRAALPKANVHYYFQNKATLYAAVLDNIVELWNSQFSTISAADDPATALDAWIREKVRLAFTYPNASKLFALEVLRGAPLLQGHIHGTLRDWARGRAAVIQAWIDQGRLRACDPMQLIFLIWSSTQYYADSDTQILALTDQPKYTAEMQAQIADFLSHTLLAGCGLTAPAQN
ncbi:MAG: TetR/AcrR family transcriptional regulator [Pseudomonadota bacterium]